MSKIYNEDVLVVPRSIFEGVAYFQGFQKDFQLYMDRFFSEEGVTFFEDRNAAEDKPSLKQIIPYCVITHENKIAHYVRGSSGGENRLHAKGSIGIGGHINPVDMFGDFVDLDSYMAALEREVQEEVQIGGIKSHKIIGLINDDNDAVGRVHLGIVHHIELDSDTLSSKEDALAELKWISADDIKGEVFCRLEPWSGFAFCLLRSSLEEN